MTQFGLLLLNTGGGRSNLAASESYTERNGRMKIAAVKWFNFGERSLISKYQELRAAGAEAIVLVANDVEGAILVREMAALPEEERIPVVSHWGVTGGDFVKQAGAALAKIDFSVLQTFSFLSADPEKVTQVLSVAQRLFGITRTEEFAAPVGFAHAYDLTHILARAIDLAGTCDRSAVRDALEDVKDYHGLVRNFLRPFTPERHEALTAADVFMARYRADGALIPPASGGAPR